MSYKIGDKVRIKSTDWYNENKDKHGIVICGMMPFCGYMSCRCGTIVTISKILEWGYCIEEDYGENGWTDEMIESLVEDEMIDLTSIVMETVEEKTIQNALTYGYNLPEGYQFTDENGNVINATKIVLEKKKKEYPKTYDECCKVLGYSGNYNLILTTDVDNKLFNALYRLKVCRDAYWKIAGDWKPEYPFNTARYVISNAKGFVGKVLTYDVKNYILEFPTEEMRDAFYENFKELIEICKELL